MSEAEGGWADLLHESALEASSSQVLSKACLRARAWCDVASANTVYCLASEGEQSSDDGSFLWPGGKYGIRRREGTGDVHKEVVCDEEGEEDPTHTFDDDSEDDTAHNQQVLSFVGAAQAPSGYKILES